MCVCACFTSCPCSVLCCVQEQVEYASKLIGAGAEVGEGWGRGG